MTIRVAQWATGAVGRAALRELIENPSFQLVGVLVYDPAKDGLDAGALCGLPPTTGVRATTDKDVIAEAANTRDSNGSRELTKRIRSLGCCRLCWYNIRSRNQ